MADLTPQGPADASGGVSDGFRLLAKLVARSVLASRNAAAAEADPSSGAGQGAGAAKGVARKAMRTTGLRRSALPAANEKGASNE